MLRKLKFYFILFFSTICFFSCKASVDSPENIVLTEIKITSMPTKLNYYVGDELDLAGLEVTAVYSNGNQVIISSYLTSIEDAEIISESGNITIQISFEQKISSFKIKVEEVFLTDLQIAQEPQKTTYYEYEHLDLTGLIIKAYYNNGCIKEITDYTLNIPTDNELSTEDKEVIISYGEKTVSYSISVIKIEITKIEIEQKPTKLIYNYGETISLEGLVIKATCNNGNNIYLNKYTSSIEEGCPLTTHGVQSVKILYENFELEFQIEVLKVLSSLSIQQQPVQLKYYEGDSFSSEGIVVEKIFSDESKEITTDYLLSISDNSILLGIGKKTINVIYNEFTAYFEIEVYKVEMISIKIVQEPQKTTYYEDDFIDYTGLIVKSIYNNGKEEILNGYEKSILETDYLRVEQKKVTITYNNLETYFNINVVALDISRLEIVSEPSETIYYYGDKINLDGLIVKAICENTDDRIITNYGTSVNNHDVLCIHGSNIITITYKNKTIEFSIEVLKKLTGISIVSHPNKVNYYLGENFNSAGLVVNALYSDESTEEITTYTLSPYNGSVLNNLGTKNIEITYGNYKERFPIFIEKNKAEIINVTFPEYQDVYDLLTYNNMDFTAKPGFISYIWWLDSTKQPNITNVYTLNTKNLPDGEHSLMLIVKDVNNNQYSTTVTIKISREER